MCYNVISENTMEKEHSEDRFIIEGNPGQGNTFVKIGHVENYNPHATSVTTNITNNHYYGKHGVDGGIERSGGRKLGNMTLREMLQGGYVDTDNIQKLIMNYVSCIRPFVKEELDKPYMQLWIRILEHDAFRVDLYDPGKQNCRFNRNLVANIMHYLDNKGFYKRPYNQSEMARAVEGDADSPVRKGFREYPDKKYRDVLDAIIRETET